MLRIALQLGIKAEPSWTDGRHALNGAFAFARPILRGHFYKEWIGYRLSMELARGDPFMLDAYLDVDPIDEFGARIGQQGTPVSRHESFGPQQIFFPEYAGVANYFWSGRERGVTLYGTSLAERLDYYAGVYTGSPIDEPVNLPNNYVVEGRLTASPLGPTNANEMPFTPEGERLPLRVSFTVQGYGGRLQTDLSNYNPANNVLTPSPLLVTEKTGSASGDLWFQYGPLIAFGEFYWRSLKAAGGGNAYSSYGSWGQVILNVYENVLGLGARMNWIDPDTDLGHDRALEAEGQLAWFIHAPELVLKARYAWLNQKEPHGNTPEGFALPFVPGTSHVATLQAMIGF
jgi:hypothetical protein